MKQLLLTIPTIIDSQTRVSWLVFKTAFAVILFIGVAFLVFE